MDSKKPGDQSELYECNNSMLISLSLKEFEEFIEFRNHKKNMKQQNDLLKYEMEKFDMEKFEIDFE
jgi:hypothetical protein